MKSNTHLLSSLVIVFLLSSCGGGGGDGGGGSSAEFESNGSDEINNGKYNATHYKNLAGTWSPWTSESDFENSLSGYFEMVFSRFGDVYLFWLDEIEVHCFGNYVSDGSSQNSSLQCNSTDENNEFFSINISSLFNNQTMVINSLEVSGFATILLEENTTLYKNQIFEFEADANIVPGVYEFSGLDTFIQIFPNGEIITVNHNALSLENNCEINGIIERDPDYGLTTELPANAALIGTHKAFLDISNCNYNDLEYVQNKININGDQQASILRGGTLSSGGFTIYLTGRGSSYHNEGNNAFFMQLMQVCDELGNPIDFDDPDICGFMN